MELSDEKRQVRQWISQVRAGNQEAFSQLLSQYHPLIESLVARYSQDGFDASLKDDMRQEATLVFYNSILTYDMEQSEVEFGLYAKICISNALVSQLRSLRHRNAELLSEMEDRNLFVHDDATDPSEEILEQERIKALYSVISKNLSVFEYRVWRYYVSGQTAKEIALRTGIDERSVNNAIYRIRKKLRTLLR